MIVFILVEKTPIYITQKKYNEIFRIVTKDLEPDEKIKAIIKGTKEQVENSKKFNKYLNEVYKKDKAKFFEDYKFHLTGDEIRQEIRYLLFDFCAFYKTAKLRDFSSFQSKLMNQYENHIDYGDVIALEIIMKKLSLKLSNLFKNFKFTCIININDVLEIKGENLADFTINLKNNVKMLFYKGSIEIQTFV